MMTCTDNRDAAKTKNSWKNTVEAVVREHMVSEWQILMTTGRDSYRRPRHTLGRCASKGILLK